MFKDRIEAGEKLAQMIQSVDIICSIPRGGIPIGYPICIQHNAKMIFAFPRKIGAPGHKEYAIGAINQHGDQILNQSACQKLGVSQNYIDQETNNEIKEIKQRQAMYPNQTSTLRDQHVVICDDGIATGLTMIAAIREVERLNPKSITIAVPVCSQDAFEQISQLCNMIVIATPEPFGAVGSFYNDFPQVEYEEAIALLDKINNTN